MVLSQITQVVVTAAYGSRLEIPSTRTTHSLALRLSIRHGRLAACYTVPTQSQGICKLGLAEHAPPGWAPCPISIWWQLMSLCFV